MKKYFYSLGLLVLLFCLTGFKGCAGYLDFIYAFMRYHATGGRFGGDSQTELYSIAVGQNGAIYTRSGRPPAPWIESQSGSSNTLNFIKVLNNPDSLVACAVGDAGTVLFSSDKGYSWIDRSIPSLQNNLFGFDFIDYGTGGVNVVVCGDGGIVYRSTNSGGNFTWQQINTITTQRLNAIGAITSALYLAAGENGTIIKTNDGGQSWENVGVSDPNADFSRIFLGVTVSSWDAGWLAGANGKIYATTDYGYTWLPRNSGTTKDLLDIFFKNPLEGVVAGKDGIVRITSDAGLTWYEDSYLSSLTTKDIVSISEIDSNTASAITVNNYVNDFPGADTTFILAVSSEPFVAVDNEVNIIPDKFILQQNYPNPFNPSTKIKYTVPSVIASETKQSQIVSLKVYDVLGNEIATLVNEEKSAGNYEVEFEASRFSSGIYFYKLQVGNPSTGSGQGFVETKKMLMIK